MDETSAERDVVGGQGSEAPRSLPKYHCAACGQSYVGGQKAASGVCELCGERGRLSLDGVPVPCTATAPLPRRAAPGTQRNTRRCVVASFSMWMVVITAATMFIVMWVGHNVPDGYSLKKDHPGMYRLLGNYDGDNGLDEAKWSRSQRLAVALYPTVRTLVPAVGWIMVAGALGCLLGGILILLSRGQMTGMTHAVTGLGLYGFLALIPAVLSIGFRSLPSAFVPTLVAWLAAGVLEWAHAALKVPSE